MIVAQDVLAIGCGSGYMWRADEPGASRNDQLLEHPAHERAGGDGGDVF